jgi:hypothetical protein
VAVVVVLPTKTVVGEGYPVNITVKVKDYGIFNEVFSLTTYVNATAVETREISLTSGASATLTFTWNTAGFAKGNYTVWAYAWPVPGETDTDDNAYIDGLVIVSMVGDLNNDGVVDIRDISIAGRAFGSYPGHSRWNPNADINNDGIIDIRDVSIIGRNYGKTET